MENLYLSGDLRLSNHKTHTDIKVSSMLSTLLLRFHQRTA